MNKVIKIFIAAFIAIVLFITLNIIMAKYEYRRWVINYLQSRYTETMRIKDTYFDDMGMCAVVYPLNNPEIKFEVAGKYVDRYLEHVLEFEAEQKIKQKYKEYECQVLMVSNAETIETPYPELYELYKKLGRPANWSEVSDDVLLREIKITIDNADKNIISQIVEFIGNCRFKSLNIKIFDGENYHTYKLNEEKAYYKKEE